MNRQDLKRLIDSSVKAGLWLAVVSIVVLLGAAIVGGAPGLALASLGATLLTIAIVNLIFEPFGKEALAADIRDMIQLHRRVAESGLTDMGGDRETVLAQIVGVSPNVDVLPWDPFRWADQEFKHLRREAGQKDLGLCIFIPSHDSTHIPALAYRLGLDEADCSDRLKQLADRLCDSWDAAPTSAGSKLEIWTFDGAPGYGLFWSEAAAGFDLGPVIRKPDFDGNSFVLAFEGSSRRAEEAKKEFAQLRLDGTQSGMRPLPPSTSRAEASDISRTRVTSNG